MSDAQAQLFPDDAALVLRAKRDPETFGLLYERYVRKIYTYLYYRTGNTHDAEDLTARTFLRALTHLKNYNDRGLPFSAWLYRIAHNLLANWHRDTSRRQILPLEEATPLDWQGLAAEAPEMAAANQVERERLWRAIRHLPEERQHLVMLKFTEHLSNAEIGVILNRTEGAVKSLYHRTLLVLRDELTQEE